jgi:hypothetical protein
MKQQTAVEYLIQQLQAPCRGIPEHIIEKAYRIQEKQMIDFSMRAYQDVSNLMNVPFNQISENRLNFENVFNETFKK